MHQSDDCRFFRSGVSARDERVLTIESDRKDCSFDDIGVDLDAAVVNKECQAVPARQRIADGLGSLFWLTSASFRATTVRERQGSVRIYPAASPDAHQGAPADDLFVRIESRNAFKRLAGDGLRPSGDKLIEAPAHMRPWIVPVVSARRQSFLERFRPRLDRVRSAILRKRMSC